MSALINGHRGTEVTKGTEAPLGVSPTAPSDPFCTFRTFCTSVPNVPRANQQALIAALERARAELVALDGGVTIFDGEPIG
jgi:hypothetical protein